MTRKDRPANRASANMLVTHSSVELIYGSGRCDVIKQATVDHVAIGLEVAAYMATGIWPAHCDLDEALPHIQGLAARWQAGSAASVRPRQQVIRPTQAPAATAVEAFWGRGWNYYSQVRRAWASRFIKGAALQGAAMGHVAFRRAGGFDGNFNKLIRSARAALCRA
jgi:hypothetical protein